MVCIGWLDQAHILFVFVQYIKMKQCMVHPCKSCPPMRNLEEYLLQQFETQKDNEEEDEDSIAEQIIQFQQWTTVNRAEIVSQSLPV